MKCDMSGDRKAGRMCIGNFRPVGGKHCWTTALKNVLEYHGLHISEEMLFGLGGGIGFIYWYMKFMRAPLIGTRFGRGADPLVNTCKRIGAEAAILETASEKKGYEELKELLRKGEPVLAFVDMAYLPYLALPEEAHFGGHTIVVFGVDEGEKEVYVADRAAKPFTISIEDLNRARNSKSAPFPPKNKLLRMGYPERIGDLSSAIQDSIRECCRGMLAPPIKNIGLAGMQKWADMVPAWSRQFKGMQLLECLFNVFLYIEISGTGGSGFRSMYAQFLKQASSVLNEPALDEVAEMMQESARLWSDIAEAALPDLWPSLRSIRELSLEKNTIFEAQKPGALEKMRRINVEAWELMKKAAQELEEREPAALLSALQQKILQCREVERAALEKLAAVVK